MSGALFAMNVIGTALGVVFGILALEAIAWFMGWTEDE